MGERAEFEMSEADLQDLLEACKAVPVMYISGGIQMGSSRQENANRAWKRLGKKMGFDGMTVRPIAGKGQRFFTAVATESNEAGAARAQEREP